MNTDKQSIQGCFTPLAASFGDFYSAIVLNSICLETVEFHYKNTPKTLQFRDLFHERAGKVQEGNAAQIGISQAQYLRGDRYVESAVPSIALVK